MVTQGEVDTYSVESGSEVEGNLFLMVVLILFIDRVALARLFDGVSIIF